MIYKQRSSNSRFVEVKRSFYRVFSPNIVSEASIELKWRLFLRQMAKVVAEQPPFFPVPCGRHGYRAERGHFSGCAYDLAGMGAEGGT